MVHINISVLALPSIDTFNLKFTADFYLNLRWYDPRLNFYDLNNATMLNALSDEGKNSIWTPSLTFPNALGPFQTIIDSLSSAVVLMEGNPLLEDVTSAHEGKK